MSELIQFLRANWATLRSAPGAFILFTVLALGAALLIAKWRYEGIVEQLRERLEMLKERLAAKDEQLGEYRQRLHLVPTEDTSLSTLLNAEIQRRALELVARIRAFLSERQARSYQAIFSRASWRPGLTEDQRHAEWERESQELMQDSLSTSSDYDARFKVDTILLRDELLSRLPASAKNEREFRTYEHPTNPIGMGMVADDLERLAKSLPTKNLPRGV